VVTFLVIGTLGIGVSRLTRETLAAEPLPEASNSSLRRQNEGNLKETVLTLAQQHGLQHSLGQSGGLGRDQASGSRLPCRN
jgi:hypothetical protein